MKCEESQVLIEEYFDGELDPQTSGLLSAHLENCASCGRELDHLAQEHQTYQQYERGVDATPALWAMVRSRIAADQSVQRLPLWDRWRIGVTGLRSLRFSVPVLAILVLSAVAGTVVVMKYLDAKQPPTQTASTPESRSVVKQPVEETPGLTASRESEKPKNPSKQTEPRKPNDAGTRNLTAIGGRHFAIKANPLEDRTPSQLVRDAERNYLSAIAMLSRDVAQRPSQLDPETRAKLDGALASIDRTISATRKAVQKNPNDPLAVQYMLTAYAKKVDVLKEMTGY